MTSRYLQDCFASGYLFALTMARHAIVVDFAWRED
jgi:hypothetical protein